MYLQTDRLTFTNHYLVVDKLLKRIKFTKLTGRLSVWNDAFYDTNNVRAWVRVAFDDGTIIQGYPKYFSDFGNVMELYFEQIAIPKSGGGLEIVPVKKFRPDGVCENYPSLLLTQKETIKSVYFFPMSMDYSSYKYVDVNLVSNKKIERGENNNDE